MSLPVLLLDGGRDAAATKRTCDAFLSQSVDVRVVTSLGDIEPDSCEFLVLALSGVTLDVTACERAVWFLATRPTVLCATGGMSPSEDATGALQSAIQFLVIRGTVARRLLATTEALHAATAIALVIGVQRETGRGAAWISEPVIRTAADAAVLVTTLHEVSSAIQHLGLAAESLIDTTAAAVPMVPQQQLMPVTRPQLRARLAPVKSLRILALFQGFPMGGYTAFNADLLPRLAASGHAITICTTEWWRTDWRLEQVRAVSPDIHHAHAVVPPAAVPAYVDWLIASRAIDVVLLSHSHLGFHLLPFLRARHPDVAFVDYVHTDWFETAMYGSYAAMAARWEGQLDAQLATSRALVAQLEAGGCEPHALRAAHIGIDTTAWHHCGARRTDVRTSLGAGPSTLVLLFAGRVSPEKRPHLAVDVAAQLRDEGHDVVLVVAGGGPMLPAMHQRSVSLGIDAKVKILGELDEPTLRHVYAAADIFIAPSEIEGIARSLYEAMAMGCIPVVSDVGGQRELVVPGTGSLVDASADDAAPYVEGVRPWLNAVARARASAAASAHIATHFDSARTVAAVSETLQLARTRRRTRQAVLPAAMADEFAVLSLEIIRRHVLRTIAR